MADLHLVVCGPNVKPGEVSAKGKTIYEELRATVETPESKGKIIAINVDTKAHLIGSTEAEAKELARKYFRRSNIFFYRVGVGAIGYISDHLVHLLKKV